jgi:hypothetical protein
MRPSSCGEDLAQESIFIIKTRLAPKTKDRYNEHIKFSEEIK